MPKPKTKTFGIRVTEKVLNDYTSALKDLPMIFNATGLLTSYMKYVSSMTKKYKKTGKLKLGFISNNKNIILVDLDNKNITEIFEDEQTK